MDCGLFNTQNAPHDNGAARSADIATAPRGRPADDPVGKDGQSLAIRQAYFRRIEELPEVARHPVVREFAAGVADVAAPAPGVVELAERATRAALEHTAAPHITVDEDDGSLDFHLRLADGLLVMANLFSDGTIDASVYDDSNGIPVKNVKRMRRTAAHAEDLIELFQGGIDAGTKR